MSKIKRYFLLMSLLSFLFGCGESSNKSEQYAQVPQFPQLDNPNCQVVPFKTDTDFFAQTFIISPDKKNVFVLAYGMAGTPQKMPYQILKLNMDGNMEHKVTIPNCVWGEIPNFWWENNGYLSLKIADDIKTFDPFQLTIVKARREISKENFLSHKRLVMMEYHETEDAYDSALQKAIEKSTVQYVRKVLNLDYLMLDFADRQAEAWYLYPNNEVEHVIAKYGEQKSPMNPPPPTEDDIITDGNTRLTFLKHNTLDYKIAYPNIKYIEERVLQLSVNNNQKARFKLGNKENHGLELHYADNGFLTTTNGHVWLLYERQLYQLLITTPQ